MGFKEAWAKLSEIERGYVNDPNDPGGETNHGVTARVARAYGYTGPMRDLSEERAADIAKKAWWDTLQLDRISILSEAVAEEILESSFNCGQSRAGTWLQLGLNALNRGQKDFADIAVDGRIGLATVSALSKYFQKRGAEGEAVLLRILNTQQGAFYLNLAKDKPDFEDFIFGWFRLRISEK